MEIKEQKYLYIYSTKLNWNYVWEWTHLKAGLGFDCQIFSQN